MRGATASDSRFKSLVKWPAFLIANAVLFLFVGVSTAREAYRGWSVDHEIAALQAQAKELEGQKMELMVLTDALAQPERAAWEARSRLGWKKAGETVAVIPGGLGGAVSSTAVAVAPRAEVEILSNPQRWWRYFFHPLTF